MLSTLDDPNTVLGNGGISKEDLRIDFHDDNMGRSDSMEIIQDTLQPANHGSTSRPSSTSGVGDNTTIGESTSLDYSKAAKPSSEDEEGRVGSQPIQTGEKNAATIISATSNDQTLPPRNPGLSSKSSGSGHAVNASGYTA
ncbi:MAG: hypothetical protein M1827_004557 [Pycnora praestabilis]|nr:MAG: hypothetical protein M1827_004557 [Pycnora praestabilis]